VEERAWERREAFLALNPAGTTPVLTTRAFPPSPAPASSPNISTKPMAPPWVIAAAATAMAERIEVRG